MLTHLTPNTIRAPFAQYSHGVVIPQGHRLLVCSGHGGGADRAVLCGGG